MVAYLGDITTAVLATQSTGGPTNWQLPGVINGRVKCMCETYTLLGSELSASTLALTSDGTGETANALPIGALILAIGLTVSAAQTSLTASLGDAGSATRYASASTGLQTANSLVWIPGKLYRVTGTSDQELLITTGGATATAGTLKAFILFTTD